MSSEQIGIHNQGNWSAAKNGGGVVSDQPGGIVRGGDQVEYYGGYLIAESMDRSNIPIVSAAPKILKALVAIRRAIGGFGSLSAEKILIDYAIEAATTPIIPPEFPPVVGKPAVEDTEPSIKYEDIDQCDVFIVGDQYQEIDHGSERWVNVEQNIGCTRSQSSLWHIPCRRPVKPSPVDSVVEPECDTEKPKPPLGIVPRTLWLEARRDDLYSAISRYRDAYLVVSTEWLFELAHLERELQLIEACGFDGSVE